MIGNGNITKFAHIEVSGCRPQWSLQRTIQTAPRFFLRYGLRPPLRKNLAPSPRCDMITLTSHSTWARKSTAGSIILEVTPHINNSEEVALKIRVESSNIRSGENLFGGAILDTRSFKTDMVVKSGETLVLGGIIQQETNDVVRKVPLLGDIPVLGYLFKKRDKVERDVELMVFLRPVVTRSPEDVRKLIEEVESKTPRIEAWNKQLEEAKLKEEEEGD